jgi:hypothetical protein
MVHHCEQCAQAPDADLTVAGEVLVTAAHAHLVPGGRPGTEQAAYRPIPPQDPRARRRFLHTHGW